jgi:hypothetical protein
MNSVGYIKEIFSRALENKAGPERDDFLAEICRGDSELRHQLESLLLAHERAGEFLGKTILSPPSDEGK